MKFKTTLDMDGNAILHIPDGTSNDQPATVGQLNNIASGLTWHLEVRAASTANVNIASPGSSLDGVTLASGDRVLLKNQTTASQNGTYIFNGSPAALTRTTDTFKAGDIVPVGSEGTANANSAWQIAGTGAIVVGTTSTTWQRFNVGNAYTAGNGISISGQVVSAVAGVGIVVDSLGIRVDRSVTPQKYAANVPSGSTAPVISHSLGTTDVVVFVREVSTGNQVLCDSSVTDANTVTLGFATAPTSGQYRVVVVG